VAWTTGFGPSCANGEDLCGRRRVRWVRHPSWRHRGHAIAARSSESCPTRIFLPNDRAGAAAGRLLRPLRPQRPPDRVSPPLKPSATTTASRASATAVRARPRRGRPGPVRRLLGRPTKRRSGCPGQGRPGGFAAAWLEHRGLPWRPSWCGHRRRRACWRRVMKRLISLVTAVVLAAGPARPSSPCSIRRPMPPASCRRPAPCSRSTTRSACWRTVAEPGQPGPQSRSAALFLAADPAHHLSTVTAFCSKPASAFDVQAVQQEYSANYTISRQPPSRLVAQANAAGRNSSSAYQQALLLQSGVVRGLPGAAQQTQALLGVSQGAGGVLQATQRATSSWPCRTSNSQLDRLDGQSGRANVLNQADRAAAQAQAQAAFGQFHDFRDLSTLLRGDVPLTRLT